MTLTRARIRELRALLAKATPGPWGSSVCKACPPGTVHLEIADDGRCSVDDAKLIGVMRDVLPALLDAYEQCGKENCMGLSLKACASWVRKERLDEAERTLEAIAFFCENDPQDKRREAMKIVAAKARAWLAKRGKP